MIASGDAPENPSDVRVLAAGRFATVEKTATPTRAWYGWNAAFSGAKQSPGEMSMHFYPGGYVGVVTFSDGAANVCGLSLNPDRAGGWSAVFNRRARSDAFDRMPCPRSIELGSATLIGEWRGVGPLPFSSSMRSSDDAVLVGDAAAVGDPFMGEGNSRALAAGPMLFNAARVSGNTLRVAHQTTRWRRAYQSRLRAGAAARWVLERPALAKRALPFLLGRPAVGSTVVAVVSSRLPLFVRGIYGKQNVSHHQLRKNVSGSSPTHSATTRRRTKEFMSFVTFDAAQQNPIILLRGAPRSTKEFWRRWNHTRPVR